MELSKVKKRKDGRYEYKLPVYDGSKVRYKSLYARSRAKLEERVRQEEKRLAEAHSPRYEYIAVQWLSEHGKVIDETTARRYEGMVNNLCEQIGEKRLQELSPIYLQTLVNELSLVYRRGTVRNYLNVLKMTLDFAIMQGYMDSNPARVVRVPKNARPAKAVTPPSSTDIDKMLEHVEQPFDLFPVLLYYTGLRRSEALALTVGDLQGGKIKVYQSVAYLGNQPYIRPYTKTASGMREVPILNALRPYLSVLDGVAKKRLVFCEDNGEPFTAGRVNSLWRQYCNRKGVDFTPHQLRHAFATLCYDAGLSPKDTQHLLGHANIQTTLDVYTAISKEREQASTDKLNQFLIS